MNQADFWKLIEEVNQSCPSQDHESMEAQMIELLIHHNVDNILDFHLIQQEYYHIAHRNELAAAGEVMGIKPTDDSFPAFLYWLISQGKSIYMAALQNPDSLANIPCERKTPSFLGFGYVAYKAYSIKMSLLDPQDMSDIYDAISDRGYYSPAPKIQREIYQELPNRADIDSSYTLEMIRALFPNLYDKYAVQIEKTGLYWEQRNKLLHSDCVIHARIGLGLRPKELYFEGTPENIAHFLATYKVADSILLTDLTDHLVVYSSGWHILSCPDEELHQEINHSLYPLQRSEEEPQTVFSVSDWISREALETAIFDEPPQWGQIFQPGGLSG